MKKVSTTKLAEYIGITADLIWSALFDGEYIDERRNITEKGKLAGGETRNFKGNQFIAWPTNFDPIHWDYLGVNELADRWKASGNPSVGMTGRAINRSLLEDGLIEKRGDEGYFITSLGKKFGGFQIFDEKYGTSRVVWPEDFLISLEAKNIESKLDERNIIPENEKKKTESNISRRRGQYQTDDGHWVASRGEALIDNFLYRYYIPHSYDRELVVHEEWNRPRCDFYIPAFKPSMNGQPVYIEFWGLETDKNYKEQKQKKIEIYRMYEFNLIQISNNDIQILSKVMARELLKFEININNQ